MTKQEQVIMEDNYKSILDHETKTAEIITLKVLDKPELSAWMILIPIIFILFMQRHQKYYQSSKGFSAGYLYTKKIALDTAYKIYNHQISREDAQTSVAKIVVKNPDAEAVVLEIYRQQIEEIQVVCEHYLALLSSKETKYDQMVVSYYRTEDNYLDYVKRLTEAEKAVTIAATANFKDDEVEVPEILEKMEEHLIQLRLEEAKRFFTV